MEFDGRLQVSRRELLVSGGSGDGRPTPWPGDRAGAGRRLRLRPRPRSAKVSFKVNGKATASSSTPAPRCSTPCASTCTSPAPRRAATTASAAPARCWSTGGASTACLTLAVMHEGDSITTIEGLGHARAACIRCRRPSSSTTASSAATARRARSARRWRCSRDPGRRAQPCERRPRRQAAALGGGAARAHERQHLPLRRLLQHRRGDHRGRRRQRA